MNMYNTGMLKVILYAYSLTHATSSIEPNEPAVDCLLLPLPTEEMVPSPEAGV